MESARKPVLLLILDGWGLGTDPDNSAIELAETPVWDRLWAEWPSTRLIPHGELVGLTEGQMGNSEVGHLNLGAGRIVYQDLLAMTKLISTGGLATHDAWNAFLDRVLDREGALHFVGLFSDGGIHSHIEHLFGMVDHAFSRGHSDIFIHALTDGRDTEPAIASRYFDLAQQRLPNSAKLATLGGRYYLMDRDKRWDRTEKHWNAITYGEGLQYPDWQSALKDARARNETDEFITPCVLGGYMGIEEGSAVVCFNFRSDRMRQSVDAWTDPAFNEFERGAFTNVDLFSARRYRSDFDNPTLLSDRRVDNTLVELLSQRGISVYKSAETEKYAHVTYFFNGGREEPWPGEDRVLVDSPKVATYDLQPEMSVYEVTQKLCDMMRLRSHDLYVVNFANGDMVGHTGVRSACIRACEAVDRCLGRVLEAGGWGSEVTMIVTADHGNCDVLTWPDGTPHTQHSMNEVPFVLVSDPRHRLEKPDGWSLRDVAPTILGLMGIDKPDDWDGSSLLS